MQILNFCWLLHTIIHLFFYTWVQVFMLGFGAITIYMCTYFMLLGQFSQEGIYVRVKGN